MEIRKLTNPQEWLESERVLATAFLHPWDEKETGRKVQEQARGAEPRAEESWGLFVDDGSMSTSISTLRHTLSFGGREFPAGEIHMVGSLPESRGGGGVRALMGEILRDFRSRGDALAVLIPFSCAFYRKFGFELSGRTVRQRLSIDQLAGFACDLTVTRVWEEQDLVPVRELWDSFALSHDLAEIRGDEAWQWRGNGDFGEPDFMHPERQRYTYVFWDESGEACAYVRFSFFHEPDLPFVGELKVSDLVWANPQALRGVLGFLYRMRAKVSHVNFELEGLELAPLVPEGDRVEQQIDSHVMARMLDVKRLLGQMPQPFGEGSYVLQVEDDFLPEVSGRWQVTYENRRATNVTCTDLAPDLVASQTVACQLVLGRISLEDALYRSGVQALGNTDTLTQVFVRRPIYLSL